MISDLVETDEYIEYWNARCYHGDYVTWEENGVWYFERDGKRCVFYRTDGKGKADIEKRIRGYYG